MDLTPRSNQHRSRERELTAGQVLGNRLSPDSLRATITARDAEAGPQTTAYTAKNRRKVRSRDLLDAIQRIDTTTDPAVLAALVDSIRAMYEERGGGELLGLFGRCFLGHPYVDHRMALSLAILHHYRHDEDPPPPFAVARPLARSDSYAFIEIYADGAIIPVRHDGTSAV
ncbi:MAG: hypothetical protein IPH27_11440 [Actinomycetales bacterium]|jgi:hypothetical protein|nr:hypothetical protein [Candidatus Phosphoribacter baldrii]MBK6956024.1 hypothetical protein [Candidatus Phosphoribacter baldrii]